MATHKISQIHTYNNEQYAALKAFVKALKMKLEPTVIYPSMTDKEIIDRVAVTNKEIEQGKFISQDQLRKESKNW